MPTQTPTTITTRSEVSPHAPLALDVWPEIPFEAWTPTRETLHRWTQILGKVRLALAPHRNHWWQVPLYVTSRGLTTSMMPAGGGRGVELELDFLAEQLRVVTTDGGVREISLRPEGSSQDRLGPDEPSVRATRSGPAPPARALLSVADFYDALMRTLRDLGVEVAIWTTPVEVADRVPFERDRAHAEFDADAARRFWRALTCVAPVMERFQSRFTGKVSPVHFFWGALDLATSRFSGRDAPPHPGAPNVARFVMREAYSREVSSCGFWPGGGGYDAPAFYAYSYPEPEGYPSAPIAPRDAFYHQGMREFILPYDAVRTARDPVETLLSFFQSAYDAAAEHGHWDRLHLDRPECFSSPLRE